MSDKPELSREVAAWLGTNHEVKSSDASTELEKLKAAMDEAFFELTSAVSPELSEDVEQKTDAVIAKLERQLAAKTDHANYWQMSFEEKSEISSEQIVELAEKLAASEALSERRKVACEDATELLSTLRRQHVQLRGEDHTCEWCDGIKVLRAAIGGE